MNQVREKINELLERYGALPRAYRRAVVPVLLALVGGGYWYFFYQPASQDLARVRAQQLELQRKLSEARSVAANLPIFEAELEELQARLQDALRQLPDSKELPVLLTDISTLGKDAGLEFKAFRPRSELPRGFYAEVPIDVEFTGGFHEIARFFDRIAKLPRIVTVSEVAIDIDREGAFDTDLRVEGSVTTFRFVEEPTPDPAAQGKGNQAQRRGRQAANGPAAGEGDNA